MKFHPYKKKGGGGWKKRGGRRTKSVGVVVTQVFDTFYFKRLRKLQAPVLNYLKTF